MASPISWHAALALSLGLLLAGCANVAPERAFDASAAAAKARAGVDARLLRSDADRQALQADIDALLQAPLTQDAAVRIAALNHPGLQATYWEAGIAQADVAQAARLRNPGFGFSRMDGGGNRETERSVSIDLAGLLTMPLRQRMAARPPPSSTTSTPPGAPGSRPWRRARPWLTRARWRTPPTHRPH
jgi:hypothetical protein